MASFAFEEGQGVQGSASPDGWAGPSVRAIVKCLERGRCKPVQVFNDTDAAQCQAAAAAARQSLAPDAVAKGGRAEEGAPRVLQRGSGSGSGGGGGGRSRQKEPRSLAASSAERSLSPPRRRSAKRSPSRPAVPQNEASADEPMCDATLREAAPVSEDGLLAEAVVSEELNAMAASASILFDAGDGAEQETAAGAASLAPQELESAGAKGLAKKTEIIARGKVLPVEVPHVPKKKFGIRRVAVALALTTAIAIGAAAAAAAALWAPSTSVTPVPVPSAVVLPALSMVFYEESEIITTKVTTTKTPADAHVMVKFLLTPDSGVTQHTTDFGLMTKEVTEEKRDALVQVDRVDHEGTV